MLCAGFSVSMVEVLGIFLPETVPQTREMLWVAVHFGLCFFVGALFDHMIKTDSLCRPGMSRAWSHGTLRADDTWYSPA